LTGCRPDHVLDADSAQRVLGIRADRPQIQLQPVRVTSSADGLLRTVTFMLSSSR